MRRQRPADPGARPGRREPAGRLRALDGAPARAEERERRCFRLEPGQRRARPGRATRRARTAMRTTATAFRSSRCRCSKREQTAGRLGGAGRQSLTRVRETGLTTALGSLAFGSKPACTGELGVSMSPANVCCGWWVGEQGAPWAQSSLACGLRRVALALRARPPAAAGPSPDASPSPSVGQERRFSPARAAFEPRLVRDIRRHRPPPHSR